MAILEPPTDSWHMLLQAALQHPGLKKVTLAATCNLEAAGAVLLTQVFAKMEEVEISRDTSHHAGMPQQSWSMIPCRHATKCIVDSVIQRSTNLKKLVLRRVALDCSMDPVLLATALNKIEVLDLGLTQKQANLLFKMMQTETSVKELYLDVTFLLSGLEPRYLFGAFDKLEVLAL